MMALSCQPRYAAEHPAEDGLTSQEGGHVPCEQREIGGMLTEPVSAAAHRGSDSAEVHSMSGD